MTRIVCISDLHEHLVDTPACELIAGDVSFAFKGDLPSKQAFLAGAFRDWPTAYRLLFAMTANIAISGNLCQNGRSATARKQSDSGR